MPRSQATARETIPSHSSHAIPYQVVAVAAAPEAAPAPISNPQKKQKKPPFLVRLLNPMRPALWRLILALVVVNALLAGVLYVDRGEIPGIISASDTELSSGDTTSVAVNGLNLRADAGMTSASIATLALGQEVYLRDESVQIDGETWWPVTVGDPSNGLDGYVWAAGLNQGNQTIRERIDIGIDNAIDRVREKVGV